MRPLLTALTLAATCSLTVAQWNPAAGQWLKSDSTDVRVMTWNIEDGICSSCARGTFSAWDALARVVADLQPDILLMQEAGDRGTGVDTVANLVTSLELFMHGGPDPFQGGTVTEYVQKYVPSYDLPYIFVSASTDGFNRNVMMSRFPFVDLNGDGKSQLSDIPAQQPDAYQLGGAGGIRGFMFGEMDLDDAVWAGDLVVGNAHLKAGGSSSDYAQRLAAAQNVAYFVDYLLQGAGGPIPDPNNKIVDIPPVTSVLAADTPVVLGGDWNEDEASSPSTRGPAAWLTQAQFAGGTDGTDRDRGDMTFDSSTHVFTGSRVTLGSVKFDYLAWQDSIVSLRRSFVFNSLGIPAGGFPPAVSGFFSPANTSSFAADHYPVVADLILPLVNCQPDLGFGGPGTGALAMCGGPLVGGATRDLTLTGGAPNQAGALLVSTQVTPVPILGGTLVPVPVLISLPIGLDGSGAFTLPGFPGGGGPASIVMQVVYVDNAQQFGLGFSNAIRLQFASF